jgi:uncharacterized membrane protein
MLLGYGTGPLFQEAAQRRDARLLAWGVAATAAFVVLRGTGIYGEPNPWQAQDGCAPQLFAPTRHRHAALNVAAAHGA